MISIIQTEFVIYNQIEIQDGWLSFKQPWDNHERSRMIYLFFSGNIAQCQYKHLTYILSQDVAIFYFWMVAILKFKIKVLN